MIKFYFMNDHESIHTDKSSTFELDCTQNKVTKYEPLESLLNFLHITFFIPLSLYLLKTVFSKLWFCYYELFHRSSHKVTVIKPN